jgi:hypothetical protein
MKGRVGSIVASLAILTLVVTLAPLANTELAMTAPSPETLEVIRVPLTFGEPEVEKVEGWDWLKLPDCHYISIPGHPALPIYTEVIQLGKVMEVSSIELKELDTIELGGKYRVMPAFKPVPLAEAPSGLTEPDSTIYEKDAFYPPQMFTYSTGMGVDVESRTQVEYLNIHFYPLSYNPVRNQVIRAKSVTLEITYSGKVPLPLPSSADRLCIIYDPSLATQASNLENFKDSRGFDAFTVSTSTIYAGSGIDDQEKIRNYIINETATNDTLYYILFGDADLIPARYVIIPDNSYDSDDSIDGIKVETDLYYAEHDLNWNTDGDSDWGEVPDDIATSALPLPDVILGRLPASDATEAQVLVDKIISYCNTLQQQNYLLLGTDPFTAYSGAEGEIVKDYIDSFVPATMMKTKLYETAGTLDPISVTDQINSGQGWLNFAGHGNWNGWSFGTGGSYTISDVNALTNGDHLPVVPVMACLTARWSDKDCIGERFLLNPNGGAIVYYGASRITWGYVSSGVTTGLAGWMDWRFSYNYFVNHLYRTGTVWANTITDYINQFGIGTAFSYGYLDWKVVAEYGTLLGDPSISPRLCSDLWIKTSNVDDGNIPAAGAGWTSPDIAVDSFENGGWQIPSPFITHENPEYENANRVYIRVRNLGCEDTNNITVNLYWADPSGGIPWPSEWYPIVEGMAITPIPAGGEEILCIDWEPTGTAIGHRCLLATTECDSDPISVHNVYWDNNVAQLNVTIADLHSSYETEFVLNPLEEQGERDLKITLLGAPKGASAELQIPSTVQIGEIEGASSASEPPSRWVLSCLPSCQQKWQVAVTSASDGADTTTVVSNFDCDRKEVANLKISVPSDVETGGEFILRITEELDGEILSGIDYLVRY